MGEAGRLRALSRFDDAAPIYADGVALQIGGVLGSLNRARIYRLNQPHSGAPTVFGDELYTCRF